MSLIRYTRKVRGTSVHMHWFKVRGEHSISYPPPIIEESGPEIGDVFLYQYKQTFQAWYCDTQEGRLWNPIREGSTRKLPGLSSSRVFIITPTGTPSWVVPDTVNRQYKHLKKEDRLP